MFLRDKFIKTIMVLFFVCIINIKPAYSLFYEDYKIEDKNQYITVIGDSYAGFFATYEANRDYNVQIFAEAGKSTRINFEMMKAAVAIGHDNILISIGVNDCHTKETLLDFKTRLEELVVIASIMNKKIYLHTYMSYKGDLQAAVEMKNMQMTDESLEELLEACQDTIQTMNKPSDYDGVLKQIAYKYKANVCYIDMSDYNDEIYLQPDAIHYNKLFYDALYDRLSVAMVLFN